MFINLNPMYFPNHNNSFVNSMRLSLQPKVFLICYIRKEYNPSQVWDQIVCSFVFCAISPLSLVTFVSVLNGRNGPKNCSVKTCIKCSMAKILMIIDSIKHYGTILSSRICLVASMLHSICSYPVMFQCSVHYVLLSI